MIEPTLQKEINQVMSSARERRLEFVTVEHLLLALLNTSMLLFSLIDEISILKISGVNYFNTLTLILQQLQMTLILTLFQQLVSREFFKEASIKHNHLKRLQLLP